VPETPPNAGLHLVFKVESLLCALPISVVVETMRPLPVRRLDRSPEALLGVAVVRGVAMPVVDTARLLGARGGAPAGRFLTVRLGERQVSLAVTSVEGVRAFGARSFAALPPLLAQADGDAVAAIGSLDEQLMLLLGGVRLVPESVFAAVRAGAEN
jgi:purine-binding chemotaxis protein CheW